VILCLQYFYKIIYEKLHLKAIIIGIIGIEYHN